MPATISLPEPIDSVLRQWSRSTKAPQRLIERATIILACADNPAEGNQAIARRVGVVRNTVAKWRNRFAAALERWGADASTGKRHVIAARVAEVLADAPRSGHPPEFTAEQVVQIIAIACELRPDEAGRPVSHWTGREVADEAIQRGIVPSISARHTRRLLKKTMSARSSSATG